MKFQDLFKNLVTEGTMSKATFNKVINRWREEKPNITSDEVLRIYNDFDSKKNGLSVENPTPIVYSFITRFDGRHGYEEFDATTQNLRNIESYSYKQIISLLKDYPKSGYDTDEISQTIFDTKDTKPTPEKIEASKGLWSDPNSAMINDGTLRVYNIMTQQQAVNFGYYVQKLNNELQIGKNNYWCIAWRPDMGSESRWPGYRRDGKSFYFVIDDSRNPLTDRYYVSALQYNKNAYGNNKYVLTPLSNNDDNPKTWEEIISVHPKLSNHKDKIVDKPIQENEFDSKNIVGQISEAPGVYEFARVSRNLKKAYIDGLGELKSAHSWRSMDTKLRKLYIDYTNKENYNNRFSNFLFINEIKKNDSEFNSLDRQLKRFLPDGIGSIIDKLLSTEFKVRRASIDNPSIKIYESKVNGLCGIYNSRSTNWIELDGIKYDPFFVWLENENDFYFDDEGNSYYVEKYTNKFKNISFYCVYDTNTRTGDSHILSQKKWEELGLLENEPKKFEPDSDVDIKEYTY